MFINEVVNYLGAWERLQGSSPHILGDIEGVLKELSDRRSLFRRISREVSQRGQMMISPRNFNQLMGQLFRERGWSTNQHLRLHTGSMKKYEIDFVREKVGVELCIGRVAYTIYSLFVTFPTFIRAGSVDLAVLIAPTRALARDFLIGVGNFEAAKTLLSEMPPAPLKYPFALLGISDTASPVSVVKITTPLDNFLINTVGVSLNEMLLLRERPEYDFKLELPENSKTAHEVCGFANLTGGGLILLGISDSGRVQGVEKSSLDSLQLKVTNIIRSSCLPVPQFAFHPFEIGNDPGKVALVIRVEELQSKPCMTQDKVYIRTGRLSGLLPLMKSEDSS
jgi:hypothetical protein